MTGTRRRLTGRIQVALPPSEAFRLFTPRGEQDRVHGWHPRFPAPGPDDTEPGTVFETSAHGQHTIWLVTDRQPGKSVSYARVTPGDQPPRQLTAPSRSPPPPNLRRITTA